MDQDILRQVVFQQKEYQHTVSGQVPRELLPAVLAVIDDPRVIVLTGPRRVGKSVLLEQIMHAARRICCYVNFDDERFLRFTADQFQLLDEVLVEAYGNAEIYFFDEVQNIEGWETFVRRLQDQGKKVVVTGSNASLLSRELGTRLTGRHRSFEVFPFSFKEYLVYTGCTWEEKDVYVTDRKVGLKRSFNAYLDTGGMPEFLAYRDPDYLHGLFESVLYRDIIVRYGIRSQTAVRELASLLVTNMSSRFTYNALAGALGLSNAVTVKEYVGYLCNSYLFAELHRYEYSLRKQLHAPKKAYLVDHGFHKVLGHLFSSNSGRMLENVVFQELRRRGGDIFYFDRDNHECDFVVREGDDVTHAVQVCWKLTPENRVREYAGLAAVRDACGLDDGLLLTYETAEETVAVDGMNVAVMPVWKWLLAGPTGPDVPTGTGTGYRS